MSDILKDLGKGTETTAKWVAFFIFLKDILLGLGSVLKTISLIIQIAALGTAEVTEEIRYGIRNNRRGILITVIWIFLGAIIFFCLGALFQSHILMTIAGFILIIPMIVIATSGQLIAKVITLYLQTIEGTLKGFHTMLLNLLRKLGINVEGLPEPQIIDEEKFAKNARNLWLPIIPVGLVSAFCIFFPAWKSVGMIPVALFLTTLMAIMAIHWADIDLAADNKKLIRTAKGKRKLYQLISLGLTVWLVWTAYSVAFPNSAEASQEGIKDYIEADGPQNAKPIYVIPLDAVIDVYKAIAEPIKQNRAQKKAKQDSLAQIEAKKAQLEAKATKAYKREFKTNVEISVDIKAGQTFTVYNPNEKRFKVVRVIDSYPFQVKTYDDPAIIYTGLDIKKIIFAGDMNNRLKVEKISQTEFKVF